MEENECPMRGFTKELAPRNRPPALLPQKGKYMFMDLQHLRKFYQVPIQAPKDFLSVILEKGSRTAMQFLTAVKLENPEMLERVSRELWMMKISPNPRASWLLQRKQNFLKNNLGVY
uniref:Glutathione S-transferase kappa 1-like isoform X2 n=1 Tax=Phascolarctos cinereus TaxID=38626 RepID=A0A6P5LDM2_PHACI|nr:glutathione S-transferase kappa 1-like isoform X2 [Phascolarctos cinereus]